MRQGDPSSSNNNASNQFLYAPKIIYYKKIKPIASQNNIHFLKSLRYDLATCDQVYFSLATEVKFFEISNNVGE